MKILNKKDILEQVTGELRRWILDATQDEIREFKNRIKKNDLMKTIKICTDIEFSFDSKMDWFLNELTRFNKFLEMREHHYDESVIRKELDAHIQKIKLGNYSASDFITTDDDIEAFKKELEAQKRQEEKRRKENAKKEQQEIQLSKEKVEKWRSENLNKNFAVSILDELQLKILKEALETELKCLSISWIQRRFSMVYAKAGSIVDFFEQNGIVSTFEEACDLGVGKCGRIIRVDFK